MDRRDIAHALEQIIRSQQETPGSVFHGISPNTGWLSEGDQIIEVFVDLYVRGHYTNEARLFTITVGLPKERANG